MGKISVTLNRMTLPGADPGLFVTVILKPKCHRLTVENDCSAEAGILSLLCETVYVGTLGRGLRLRTLRLL